MSDLTEPDRQLLTEAYQRAKERHERRNELLIAIEQIGCFESIGGQACCQTPPDCFWSATDLRIIADELDRRNDLDKPKSSAHTATQSAKD